MIPEKGFNWNLYDTKCVWDLARTLLLLLSIAVCLGSFFCCRINPFPNNFTPPGITFLTRIVWYCSFLIIPLIRTSGTTPVEHIPPKSWPPPCYTVGTRQLWRNGSFFIRRTNVLHLLPNNLNLLSSVHNTRFHCVSVHSTWSFAHFSLFLMLAARSNGFLAPTLPIMVPRKRERRTVVWLTGKERPRLKSFVISGSVFRLLNDQIFPSQPSRVNYEPISCYMAKEKSTV